MEARFRKLKLKNLENAQTYSLSRAIGLSVFVW